MYEPGTQLGGRYRLQERIGAGGMGEVWRGIDEVLGRTVAVKVMLPAFLSDGGFVQRFRGEARTMANLNHPGVVDVYDYHSDSSAAFLVMEYVEGEPLSAALRRVGRLTAARTMALVAQAADALQAAHDKGIVHRDVKPGNLMVRPDGTLVLTDFGIARSELVGQLTATGAVLGTAGYLSPEQAQGSGATAASDVYALGVVAYQCLAGHRPFEGDNPVEVAMKHLREPPPPLPADTPPAARDIVMRAMAKDPAQRWPSAGQLAAAARRVAAGAAPGGVSGHDPDTVPDPATVAVAFPTSPAAGPGGAYRAGVASIPVQPVPSAAAAGPLPPRAAPARGGPSAVSVAAVVLAVVAVLLCAGLVGYVARRLADGDTTLSDLFPLNSIRPHIEGSTTT